MEASECQLLRAIFLAHFLREGVAMLYFFGPLLYGIVTYYKLDTELDIVIY